MRYIVLTSLLLGAAVAVAQPPSTMNFQGTLSDGGGVPVADGSYNVTFRIWDSGSGGSILWNENRTVTVDGGVFNVILGAVNPLVLPFDDPYWLGVQVGSDPELTPRTPLTSVPYALNVADGAAVASLNGLTDDLSIVGGSNINVTTSGQDIVVSGTGSVSDGDWSVAGDDLVSIPGGNVGIGTPPATAARLHVDGTIRSGAGTHGGSFQAQVSGGGAMSYFGGDYGGFGSMLQLGAENGGSTISLQPDIDEQGGYLTVYRQDSVSGFSVDGNFAGSGSPRVTISGLSSSAAFNTDATGDDAVVLAVDAIASEEMLDEPGLASVKSNATSPYNLDTSVGAIASRTITCPSDGYVFVSTSFEIDLNHDAGTTQYCSVGVSDDPGVLPNNQDLSLYLPSGAAAGTHLVPSSATGVFQVSEGANTLYLVGFKNSSSADIQVWDVQMTTLFFPTGYGIVTTTDGGKSALAGVQDNDASGQSGPTASDLARERSESEAYYRQQRDAEMVAMRERLDSLQRQLDELNEVAGLR